MVEPMAIDEQYREKTTGARVVYSNQRRQTLPRRARQEISRETRPTKRTAGRGRLARMSKALQSRSKASATTGDITMQDRALALAAFGPLAIGLGTAYLAQVAFGLLSLALTGLMALGDASFIVSAFIKISGFLGVSITALFAGTLLIPLGIGVISMAVLVPRYLAAGIHVLSGEALALKYIITMCMFPFMYFPIINLFPWVLAYALIMVWYPK